MIHLSLSEENFITAANVYSVISSLGTRLATASRPSTSVEKLVAERNTRVLKSAPDGDNAGLALHDEPRPTPGRNEVVVRVHAVSLYYRDHALLDGKYPAIYKKDCVPISDGAGEVVLIGAGVTRVKVVGRVASSCTPHWIAGEQKPEHRTNSLGFTADGWAADYTVLHENGLVRLPDYMTYSEAATLACAAVTAWTSVNLVSTLQPVMKVLVQGTGGTTIFALQIAKMFGARVLAITSSDDKARKLKELGAEVVVNYSSNPDWEKDIFAATGGVGVDKVVDIAGEKTIGKSAVATKIGGEVALVGFTSGFGGGRPPIDILGRELTLRGVGIGPRESFEALLRAMTQHEVHPLVDRVFPFAEYREAYELIKNGNFIGKVAIDFTK